jgi:hypothetical protein
MLCTTQKMPLLIVNNFHLTKKATLVFPTYFGQREIDLALILRPDSWRCDGVGFVSGAARKGWLQSVGVTERCSIFLPVQVLLRNRIFLCENPARNPRQARSAMDGIFMVPAWPNRATDLT